MEFGRLGLCPSGKQLSDFFGKEHDAGKQRQEQPIVEVEGGCAKESLQQGNVNHQGDDGDLSRNTEPYPLVARQTCSEDGRLSRPGRENVTHLADNYAGKGHRCAFDVDEAVWVQLQTEMPTSKRPGIQAAQHGPESDDRKRR